MADYRAPGDNAVKTRSRSTPYKYMENGVVVSSGTSTWNDFYSRRPTYAKGSVITLPSGSTFRTSTSYTHESWEVGAFADSIAGPYVAGAFNPKTYFATDGGRDGAIFLAGQRVLKGLTVTGDARNEAVTKALNKMADQKVNLGENLATFGQTLNLFVSKGNLLLKTCQEIQRNNHLRAFLRRTARDLRANGGILNVAAGEYLAYIYGLRPLMQDVYETSELLKKRAAKDGLMKTSGTARRQTQKGRSLLGNYTSSKITVASWTSVSQTKCTLWARIDPNHRGMRSLNQLGLSNPAGLAWDLVSYSFVVDWFVPVGPVLYALTAPWGLIFVDGSISYRNSETLELEYEIKTANYQAAFGTMTPSVVPIAYEGYQRQRLTAWPLPGLWIATDPFIADRPLKALALGIRGLNRSGSPIR